MHAPSAATSSSTVGTDPYSVADIPVSLPDIDGWLRAMSAPAVETLPDAASGDTALGSDTPYDPCVLQTYALWNDLAAARVYSRPALGEWDADLPLPADIGQQY